MFNLLIAARNLNIDEHIRQGINLLLLRIIFGEVNIVGFFVKPPPVERELSERIIDGQIFHIDVAVYVESILSGIGRSGCVGVRGRVWRRKSGRICATLDEAIERRSNLIIAQRFQFGWYVLLMCVRHDHLLDDGRFFAQEVFDVFEFFAVVDCFAHALHKRHHFGI